MLSTFGRSKKPVFWVSHPSCHYRFLHRGLHCYCVAHTVGHTVGDAFIPIQPKDLTSFLMSFRTTTSSPPGKKPTNALSAARRPCHPLEPRFAFPRPPFYQALCLAPFSKVQNPNPTQALSGSVTNTRHLPDSEPKPYLFLCAIAFCCSQFYTHYLLTIPCSITSQLDLVLVAAVTAAKNKLDRHPSIWVRHSLNPSSRRHQSTAEMTD